MESFFKGRCVSSKPDNIYEKNDSILSNYGSIFIKINLKY